MPRNSPTRPTRRGDGRPDSYGSGSTSDAAAGEEKCTTVAIRLRPLNDREKAAKQSRIWRCVPTHNSVTQTAPDGNPLPDAKGSTFFTYDRIFDEDSSTQQVYEGVAREIVHSVVRGLNGTIFAYGQTSSGKTFTMQGGDNNRTPGIVQMAARDLFDLMEQAPDRVFLMRVSYLEIYQEDIKDLLNPESPKLQVREDPRKGVYIDAHEEVVSDFSHVLNILNAGEKQRHVGCTEMNSRSSRSHTLFRLVVESQEHYAPDIHSAPEDVDPAVLVATLNLVDLAGSESVRHTGATGQRQKEGGKINQSLLTLSRVIQTLSQGGTAHVNYRDSKLTRILQPSLSGNAGMAIICCATAAEGYLEETRSTLQFASRAKEIKTRAIVNEVLDDKAQLRRMSQELAALKRQQAEGENGSALVETLQAEKAEQAAKIERLTNLLINNAPVDETPQRHVKRSPRYRRSKRSRETWCPGEGGVPLPLALLDPNSRIPAINEEDFENARKRRSTASAGTPVPKARSTGGPPRTPLTGRRGASATTPGFMSPARARAQQDVAHMQERLADLQAERDAKVAEAEAAAVEIARVRQLENEVSQREEEVALLKEQLESASRAAAETAEAAAAAASAQATEPARDGPADMSEDDDLVGAIAAQLEEAVKAKEALEAELTEFGEYTDMRDQEMVEMKERMTVMEEALRQKEAELAAEEREEAENARRAEELQERVLELEAAIRERDGSVDRMNTSEDDAEEQKAEELAALKVALEACHEELAEHMTRANDAEEELEKLVGELSSTKARLAEEREAAERAAHEAASAVEAAKEAAEAASHREQDAASASRERVAALESEKTELQEQEAKLRAGNEEAAALLAEHEAYLNQVADADAQTDADSTARSEEEVKEAKRAVATAQADVAERDRLLAGLEGRVEELKGSLADARVQQREQEIRRKEDRDRADASLIETLTGQRRAEDALSAAYQSQLEMRCRLEEAVQNLEAAEAERDEMAEARSEAKAKVKEVAALERCVAERDVRLLTVEQARDAAASLADEARRQADDHEAAAEAREARITELVAVVEELRADNEHRALLEEESEALRAEQLAALLSEKQEMEKGLVEARADGEALKESMEVLAARETDSRVDEVSQKLAASVAEAEAARVQLCAAAAAASQAEAKNMEEIARLVEEADDVKELSAAVQSQLEAKVHEVAALTESAGYLETRVSAAEKREAADAERIGQLETQMETTLEQLAEALSEAENAALEGDSKNAEDIARLVKEVESSKEDSSVVQLQLEAKAGEVLALTETSESLVARLSAAEAAAGEKEVADAARIGELEAEMKTAHAQLAEALAGAKSMISEAEAKNAEEIARMIEQVEAAQAQSAVVESQLEAMAQEVSALTESAESLEARLSAAKEGAEERGAADAARIEGLEADTNMALARAEGMTTEAEAMTAEKIRKLFEEVEASKGESAAVQSKLEAKVQEILALTESAESLESRLSAAEAAAEERGAADAARIEGLEAEMKTGQDQLVEALARAEGMATEAEAMTAEKITKLVEEVEASKGESAAVQSTLEAKVQEILALTESAESLGARLSAAEAAAEERGAADAARIEGLEDEMKTGQDQLIEALARAEGMATETEVMTAEKIRKLVEEVEASKGESAAVQSKLEAKVQEVLALTESAESLEARLSAAEAAAEERGAADAARIEGLEAEMNMAQDQLVEALARAEGMTTEAEAMTAGKITKLVEEVEASKGESAAVQSKLEAKVQEILALTESAKSSEARLSAAEAAAEERGAADAARIEGLEDEMKTGQDQLVEALARADGMATEAEAMTAEKITKLVEEVEAWKGESAAVQSKLEAKAQEVLALTESDESLAARLSAAEAAAGEKMAADAARIVELEAMMQAAHDQIGEVSNEAERASTRAFELASEAEAAEQLVAALEKAMADAAAVHEAEASETRAALDLAEASVTAKDEYIVRAQQQAADELREVRDAAAAAAVAADEAAAEKEATIAALEENVKEQEVVGSELTQALEDSENLSKDVLDLTDQLVEKEAKLSAEADAVAELQQQIETASTEIATLKESIASSISADNSADIEHNSAELRRLRVELDKRGSELDTAMKDATAARAELKEMKSMLTAAEAGAGAAGADEDSLRKRLSQLVCENGLLKGEKERFEALSRQAASESKTSSSRAAADTERLEREVDGLRERADKASDLAADGKRVKAALGAMEARLGEVRQERAELQEATQRSLDRCSAAESEANTLRERLAEIQGRDQSRDAVISLETRVDELEEDVRRATASKVEMEGEVRASANRVKRLQGEVDMMRSEYEIVSEEAMGLRGSLVAAEAKLEEALSASQAVPDPSADRSEELEAEIARLLDEREGLEAAHENALAAERAARDDLEAQREAAIGDKEAEIANLKADHEALCHAQREERLEVRAQRDADIRVLEEAVADAEDAFVRSEAEKKELSKEARVAAAAVAAAEDSLRTASEELAASGERLAEAIDAGKAMGNQLRHRLDTQVAEAENLREELAASHERSDRAEASVRASEQRAREGADEKTKGLLEEMENLCQEKLLAENRADEMEVELERLREDVACAEQRAAREQSKIISASKQHMAGLEEAAAKKDHALEELQASLEASRDAETAAAQTAESLAEKTRSATEAVAALRTQAEENERVLEQKDARIKHLEGVRLTKDQVDKLQAMKVSARNTAAENKALKERLAAFGAGKGGAGASGEAIAQAAALAGANERIDELQGAKNNLMEKLRQYGKRLHELEKEHARVRAAVEKAGYSAPEGCDLGDAVLEIAERSAGTDGSMMSSFSGGEGSAIAAAVAASERHQAEMEDAMAALQSKEVERLAVQEQMRAGVARFRVLEAKEASARERLEAVEAEHREAVSVALRSKEKDHERQLKFLQEENVTLFQENSDMKAKADKYKAEVQALQGKVASAQAPESATKKRPCADRTNVPTPAPTAGKPGAAAPQHTAAADRRARSRALLESPAVADEEGAGECNQS